MLKARDYVKVLGCSTALAVSGLAAVGPLASAGVASAWAAETISSVESSTTTPVAAEVEFLPVTDKEDNWWRLPTINFDGVLPTDGPFTISVERVDGPGRLISAVLNDDGEWVLGVDSANLERALYLQDPESAMEWWFSEAGRYQLTFHVAEEDGTKETYVLGFLVGNDGELTVDESHGLGAAFAELGEALRGLDQVIHGDNATPHPAGLPQGIKEAPAVDAKEAHYHAVGAAPQVVRAPAPSAPSVQGAPSSQGAIAAPGLAPIPARVHPAPAAPAAPAPPPPPPAPASPSPTNPLATMPAEEGTQAEDSRPADSRPAGSRPEDSYSAPHNQTQAAALHNSQGIWGTLAAGGWVSGFMLGVGAMAFIGGFLLFLASLFIRRQPARTPYDPHLDGDDAPYMTSPTHP